MLNSLDRIGELFLSFFEQVGSMLFFLLNALRQSLRPPYRPRLIIEHMFSVGVGSLFIVGLTGTFTGAVFTLQSIAGFATVGMENIVGSTVLLAVSRELAPVLTSLMVAGRVGSAMATELGTMRVTEQIDAMEVMGVNPVKYLIVPRLFAATFMVPILTVIFTVVAGVGSYAIAIPMMGLDEGAFFARIEWLLNPYDFIHGLVKSIFFGVLIAVIGCYKGYNAKGGARGVGNATTQSVVISSIAIFVVDYVLTSILLIWAPS
ncbi:MAG: ABC transporter permease [Myxococcota bacterium]|nr:ABC transporter permease [Myxococcota bacterium]